MSTWMDGVGDGQAFNPTLSAHVMEGDLMRQGSICDLLPVTEIDIGDFLAPGAYFPSYSGRYRRKNVEVIHFTDCDVFSSKRLQEASALLESIQCPTVVSMIGLAWWRGSFWGVLDAVPGASLSDMLESLEFPPDASWSEKSRLRKRQARELSPSRVASWCNDLVTALQYLSEAGVRPILTSENLIVATRGGEPPPLMLKHPGESLYLDPSRMVSNADEKVRWFPPELLRGACAANTSDHTVQWSFGIVLSEICACSSPPYADTITAQVIREVGFGGRKPEVTDNFPPLLAKVISKCLQDEPADRPDFASIRAIFQSAKPTQFRVSAVAPAEKRFVKAIARASESFVGALNDTIGRRRRKSSSSSQNPTPAPPSPPVSQPQSWLASLAAMVKPRFLARVTMPTPPRPTKPSRGFSTRTIKLVNPSEGTMGLEIIPYGTGADTGAVIIEVTPGSVAASNPIVQAGQVIVGINTELLIGQPVTRIERMVSKFPSGQVTLHLAPMSAVEPVMTQWTKRECKKNGSLENVLALSHDPDLAEFLELERSLANQSPIRAGHPAPNDDDHDNSFEQMHEAVQTIRKRILLLDDSISCDLDGLAPLKTRTALAGFQRAEPGSPQHQTTAVARAVHADNVDWSSGTGKLDGSVKDLIKRTVQAERMRTGQRGEGDLDSSFDPDSGGPAAVLTGGRDEMMDDEDLSELPLAMSTTKSRMHALAATANGPSPLRKAGDRTSRLSRRSQSDRPSKSAPMFPPRSNPRPSTAESARRRPTSSTSAAAPASADVKVKAAEKVAKTTTTTQPRAAKTSKAPRAKQTPLPSPIRIRTPSPDENAEGREPVAPETPAGDGDGGPEHAVLGFVTTSHFNPSGSHIVNEKRLHKQATQHDLNLHVCSKCGFSSKSPNVLANHVRAKHPTRVVNRELNIEPSKLHGFVPKTTSAARRRQPALWR